MWSLCRDAHGGLRRPRAPSPNDLSSSPKSCCLEFDSGSTSSPPPSSAREQQCPKAPPGVGVFREPPRVPAFPLSAEKPPRRQSVRFPGTRVPSVAGTCASMGPKRFSPSLRLLCDLLSLGHQVLFNKACLPFEISHWWGWQPRTHTLGWSLYSSLCERYSLY